MMAAMGKQLKQSVNVFHNFMLYRLLPVNHKFVAAQFIASFELLSTLITMQSTQDSKDPALVSRTLQD